MGSVLNPLRPTVVRSRRRVVLFGLLAVIAALLLFVLTQRLIPSPSFVDRVTIVNPTPYQINVEVSGAGRDIGIGLGAVPREQTKTFEDVLDQGDQWIFRFFAAGFNGGEVSVSKEDLLRGQWKLTVPGAVAERLAAAGASPSAHE